jgi:hypothetical protein
MHMGFEVELEGSRMSESNDHGRKTQRLSDCIKYSLIGFHLLDWTTASPPMHLHLVDSHRAELDGAL